VCAQIHICHVTGKACVHKSLQDQTCNVTVLLHSFSVDENVIEVHTDHSFHNEVLKISFIIVWKVEGLFVRPKNITSGLNNLQLV